MTTLVKIILILNYLTDYQKIIQFSYKVVFLLFTNLTLNNFSFKSTDSLCFKQKFRWHDVLHAQWRWQLSTSLSIDSQREEND